MIFPLISFVFTGPADRDDAGYVIGSVAQVNLIVRDVVPRLLFALPRFDLTVLDFLTPPVDVRDLDTWLLFGSGSPLMFAGLEWRVMMVARLFSRPSSIEPRPRLGSRGPGGEASAPNGGLRCSRASCEPVNAFRLGGSEVEESGRERDVSDFEALDIGLEARIPESSELATLRPSPVFE